MAQYEYLEYSRLGTSETSLVSSAASVKCSRCKEISLGRNTLLGCTGTLLYGKYSIRTVRQLTLEATSKVPMFSANFV